MAAPARKFLAPQPPLHLLKQQPPAKFAIADDCHLTITVGDTTLVLTPEDLRRLDRFRGAFAPEGQ